MTIHQLLLHATRQLEQAGSETPALDAELLLAFVLEQPQAYLLAHGEMAVSKNIEQKFSSYLNRLSKGEPVAYILKNKEFFGLDFYVDGRVLIPRPETEILVEEALSILRKKTVSDAAVIDVGTGSGAIAISIAKEFPHLPLLALDFSKPALVVAQKNAQKHQVKNIQFLHSDLLQTLPKISQNQVVLLANLPYVASDEMVILPKNVRDFEPALALDGGEDGLELYRKLLAQIVQKFKRKTVYFLFECDPSQIKKMKELIQFTFLHPQIKIFRDLAGKQRGGVVKVEL